MKTIDFITDSDFSTILQTVKKFSDATNVPYPQQVHEITLSFMNSTYLTIVGKNDDSIVAYLTGFFYTPTEFLITQIYSEDPHLTPTLLNFLETHLETQGVTKIFGLVKPNPRVFERYGYKIERYIMSKHITPTSNGGD